MAWRKCQKEEADFSYQLSAISQTAFVWLTADRCQLSA
jgi:hypothetical protein